MTPLPKSVLILEDDVLIALDLAMIVEDLGPRILGPFHSADAAEASLSGEVPDAAILDFNLGHQTSEKIARTLSTAGVRIVFLTGHAKSHLRALVDVGTILSKPVSPTELKRALTST